MQEMHTVIVNNIPISVTAGMRWLYDTRDRALGRRHCNAQYEITLILKGTCVADVTEEQLVLKAGQAIIIPPGLFHYFKSQPGIFERFTFRFSLPESSLSRSIRTRLPRWHCFKVPAAVSDTCRELYRLYEQKDLYWQELYGNRLTALLLQVLRLLELGEDAPERYIRAPEDDRASRIDRYIEDHLADDRGIDGLAEYMHLSRRQMVRVVQEIYGIGFREKLLYARMDRAAWLLRTTNRSVSSIVEAVGYSSQTAFQRTFRSFFQTTPQQYRKQNGISDDKNTGHAP